MVLVVTAALAACGGAAKEAEAPPTAPDMVSYDEPAPTTVEEAQAQIDRARTRIGVGGSAPAGGGGQATSSSSGAAPRAPVEAPEEAPVSPCATACRALSSMERAVGTLCRLAGDEDARCTDARRTLTASRARVQAQGCSCPTQ